MAKIFVSDNRNKQIVIFDAVADTASATTDRAFNAPAALRGLQGIKIGAVNCYCIDWRTKSLVIFPKNIANGGQPTPQQTTQFRFPSDVHNPIAVAIDEANNRGYVADGNTSKIYVFALDTPPNTTAAEIKAIPNPANASTLTGLCIDANEILYAVDNVGPDFHCFPAATPDGTAPTGDALVQFNAPADLSMPQGLDVLGDTLFCLDVGGFVVTLSKKTANGDTAAKIAKFDTPPEVGTGTGLGIEPEKPPEATPLKDLHYNGHPVSVSVKIHDQDVTEDTLLVDDILQGIDYPNLTEFRVGEASITLRDIHGDFSPNNPSNFFTQNDGQRTGRNSPIEIAAGFIRDGTTHTETIFKGTILRLVIDAKAATVKAVCSDNFGDMRKKTIADFGVSRHFMLTADTEPSNGNGYYPIMPAVMPASDGSVSLARRTGETLKPAQKLETEGTLNPRNFIIDHQGVRTEGGLIVDRQVGYPQIRMKSPYRYRHIQDVIADILTHAGITDSAIEIPEQDVDAHFSSNGRVNYDLLGTIGSSNPITWNGYVTDFLYDGDNDKWYFLYNKHRNNPNGISQVIEYDETTRTYSQLHKFSAATEVWKFVKQGDDLFVVANSGGNYDANEMSSENQILQLDISTDPPTETVFVAHTHARQPQLAHYYAGVGAIHHLPDSRRQLIFRQNDGLYYAYCDRANSQFGVAKATAQNTTSAIITINLDTYENHGGLAFDINASGVLHGTTTFISGSRSQILAFKKAL